MKNISEVVLKPIRPERVIQFGEGGFLRGFVDWMLQKLNDQTDFNGSVVVVQPIEQGMCDALEEQNCVYTHIMRGLENGKSKVEKQIVDVISRTVKPYADYNKYLELAKNPDFRFIFSNHPGISALILKLSVCKSSHIKSPDKSVWKVFDHVGISGVVVEVSIRIYTAVISLYVSANDTAKIISRDHVFCSHAVKLEILIVISVSEVMPGPPGTEVILCGSFRESPNRLAACRCIWKRLLEIKQFSVLIDSVCNEFQCSVFIDINETISVPAVLFIELAVKENILLSFVIGK